MGDLCGVGLAVGASGFFGQGYVRLEVRTFFGGWECEAGTHREKVHDAKDCPSATRLS